MMNRFDYRGWILGFIALTLAAMIATMSLGCASSQRSVVQVQPLTVVFTDREEIVRLGWQDGIKGNALGLWSPATRTIYVEDGDACTLGHEMLHVTGRLPAEERR